MLTSSGAGRVHPSGPAPSARTRNPQKTPPEPVTGPSPSNQITGKKTPPKPVTGPSPGTLLVADDVISRRVYIRRGSPGGGGRIRRGNHSNRRLVFFFITPSLALMAATATANSLFFAADITFSLRKDLLQEGSACSPIPNHSGLTSMQPPPPLLVPLIRRELS